MMRPAAEVAQRFLTEFIGSAPALWDKRAHRAATLLTLLIEAARWDGAEQMRERAAQKADAPIPPPKNSPRIRRPYRAVIAAAIRALPLPGEG